MEIRVSLHEVNVAVSITRLCWLVASVAAPNLAVPACATPLGNYTYAVLDAPGAVSTTASAVNGNGLVAGIYNDSNKAPQPFVWSAGSFTVLKPKVGTLHVRGINAINDQGIVALYASAKPNMLPFVGFLYDLNTGKTTDVNVFGNPAEISGLNNKGAYVGTEYDYNTNSIEGYLVQKHVTSYVTLPGSEYSYANAISDKGVVVGSYFVTGGIEQDFTLQNGTYTTWMPKPTLNSEPIYIDSAGDIAGNLETSKGPFEGFIKRKAGYKILSYPQSTNTEMVAVIPGGQAIGTYNTQTEGTEFTFNFVGGVYYNLSPPNAMNQVIAGGMNENGTIVGSFSDGTHLLGFVATCAGGANACSN